MLKRSCLLRPRGAGATAPARPGSGAATAQPPPANWSLQAVEEQEIQSGELMLDLSRYILLLAVLVVRMTYASAFSPPGGVWQDSDPATGRLAGDSIIRTTSTHRYLVFYYCNATAFASSLVVIVMVFFLALRQERRNHIVNVKPLQAAMVLDLLSVMGAYGAGTCRDKTTTIFSLVLVGVAFLYLVAQISLASFWFKTSLSINGSCCTYSDHGATVDKCFRKVLMLLATFMASFTYVAGMSTPGGFWDAGSGHPPGQMILGDGHGKRLTVFLCFNALAFVASLLILVVLLDKRPHANLAYGCIIVALISLIVAYTAGSCREIHTTVYVSSLVGVFLVSLVFMILLQLVVPQWCIKKVSAYTLSTLSRCTTAVHTFFWTKIQEFYDSASTRLPGGRKTWCQRSNGRKIVDKAGFLVLLLATLTATITYQAGLNPPGGVWPDNGGGHMAGDPILLTTGAKRFKAFFYCNSIAFAASLLAIILVQNKLLLETYVLEATMILELFGLMGAYAAGSCRDVRISIYVVVLAGAVLVYVVIHVVLFTLKHTITDREIKLVEKRRKRLLLFAVLAATITYQAGLSPPGGFRLHDDGSSSGHRAGDPNLLYNSPHRYNAFFYCNSGSFMLSIALIILLLVNPHLCRPGIRSYALDICTAMSTFGLMGAYAAGSTQRLTTSIYTFVLLAVVLLFIAGLVLYSSNPKVLFIIAELLKYSGYREGNRDSRPKPENDEDKVGKTKHAKRKYLMLLGILVASVTYQAGLSPPGGTWQSNSGWNSAGDPVMYDNRRPQYLVFFYSNSTSFVASIVVIVLLLRQWCKEQWSFKVMNTAIFLDFLALVVAYAAGSTRGWKTSMYVVALIAAMLAYVAVHIMLAFSCLPRAVIPQHESLGGQENAPQSHEQTNRRVPVPLFLAVIPMSLP